MKGHRPLAEDDQITKYADHPGYAYLVGVIRALLVLCVGTCVYYADTVQKWTNNFWFALLQNDVFNSVYFESWHATICYALIIPVYPYALHYIKPLDKYKIHPSVTYEHKSPWFILREAVIYMTPLMLLDTVVVKQYDGVDPSRWAEKRKSWFQSTRALPLDPPSFTEVAFDLLASVVLYDAFFFVLHYALHKNFWLYKRFHALHHEHDVMHPHVTNQLSVGERIALVLTANFALKAFSSHPMTRMFFVPIFVWLLVDNHTGYDLPWGLHRVVPFGLLGGPRKHYAHHMEGGRQYQPFLTYLDSMLELNKKTACHTD